jgi:hypothetical protein
MPDTTISLTPAMRARMAKPHTDALQPTKLWDLPAVAGAGALRSDANDIMTFLAAAMGLKPSPLKPAFDDMLKVRRPAQGRAEVALGWHVIKLPDAEVVFHDGGTGGYRTTMAYDPARKVGVTVLTNAATQRGATDIALHLLMGRPLAPATAAPVVRTAVTLAEAQLKGLVGRYQLAPGLELTITQNAARLFAQVTGQGTLEVFAESPMKFFWKVVDAQLTFEVGADGAATGVTLHQNGRNLPAGRIKD